MVKGIIFDIDGVLITSWKALPYAVNTVNEIRERGLSCGFLTNTTSKSTEQIYQILRSLDFACQESELITASRLTANYVRENFPKKFCWLLNEGDLSSDFMGVDYTTRIPSKKPDLIILGGAGHGYSHERLSKVYEYLLAGVPAIAMHRSYFWATEQGINIDTGIYLEGFQAAMGKKIPIIAKPSSYSFAVAAQSLGWDPSELMIVGDDISGDVLAGQVSGMLGVLVRTGKFRQESLEEAWKDEFGQVPDYVISHIGELPALLDRGRKDINAMNTLHYG